MPQERAIKEAVVRQICHQVLSLAQLQALPDDDVLHCAAIATALTEAGVPSQWGVDTLNFEVSDIQAIRMAHFTVEGQLADSSGKWGLDIEQLARKRAAYLSAAYGLKVGKLEYVAGDVLMQDVLADRPANFAQQYVDLAHQALVAVGFPGATAPGVMAVGWDDRPQQGGPLVRSRYTTRIERLLEREDVAGMFDLLRDWQGDQDVDRPANLPQQMANRIVQKNASHNHPTRAPEVVRLMKHLRQMGVDLHHQRCAGSNFVYLASESGQTQLVRYLVEQGVAIDCEEKISGVDTSLACAIYAENEELAQYLIEQGADVNALGSDGKTALCAATHRMNLPLMEDLLDRGAKLDVVCARGQTLLHMLCETNPDGKRQLKQDLAARLMSWGLSPYQQNSRLETPIDIVSKGEPDLARFMEYEWQARSLANSTPNATTRQPRRTL